MIRAGQCLGEIRSDVDPLQAAEIYLSVLVITIRLWLTDYWSTRESLEERGIKALDLISLGLVPRSEQENEP